MDAGEETFSAMHSTEFGEENSRFDDEVLESYTKIWNSVLPDKSSRSPNLVSSSSPCNITLANLCSKHTNRFQAESL